MTSQQQRFVDLDSIERALALVLLLPRRKEALSTTDPKYRSFESIVDELVKIFESWGGFHGLLNRLRSPSDDAWIEEYFIFRVRDWTRGTEYTRRRRDLINRLVVVRAVVLEGLKLVPDEPEEATEVVAPTSTQVPTTAPTLDPGQLLPRQDEVPTWIELSDFDREIVVTLRDRSRLAGVEIAKKLGRDLDVVKRRLSELRKRGILENKKGSGYWIARIPPGAPDLGC
jgi:hypothetical protein